MIRDYTAAWTFTSNVAASSTTTSFYSYRYVDDAVALKFNLNCGGTHGGGAGATGVNCDTLVSGSRNPAGGSGCDIDMGKDDSGGWHDVTMNRQNTDTYIYACNGPQHSSSYDLNHRCASLPFAPVVRKHTEACPLTLHVTQRQILVSHVATTAAARIVHVVQGDP